MEILLEIVKSVFWLLVVMIVLFDGEIAEWLEAKTDRIRAETEKIRAENEAAKNHASAGIVAEG